MKIALRTLTLVVLLAVVAAGLVFYLHPLWVNDLAIRAHLWKEHIRSEEIIAGGSTIHYFEAAPPGGGGTPLLLVHGLGARGEDWAGLMPGLAANGFHVYAPDLLGYGRSSKPDIDYTISQEAAAMLAFEDALHLTRVDLAGWSMGGWIAMKMTLEHPERVDRLVLYDSAGIYFPATFDAELFTPDDPEGLHRLTAILSPRPVSMPGFVQRAALRKLETNAWVIQRSLAAMTGGKDLLDFRVHLIDRPTLIVWGSEDQLIPLSVGETLHREIARSSLLVVDGCGHLAPAECRRPVLHGTLGFLKAEPPPVGQTMHLDGTAPAKPVQPVPAGH